MTWFVLIIYSMSMQSAGWSTSGPMTRDQCETAKTFITSKVRPSDWTSTAISAPVIMECVPVGEIKVPVSCPIGEAK